MSIYARNHLLGPIAGLTMTNTHEFQQIMNQSIMKLEEGLERWMKLGEDGKQPHVIKV